MDLSSHVAIVTNCSIYQKKAQELMYPLNLTHSLDAPLLDEKMVGVVHGWVGQGARRDSLFLFTLFSRVRNKLRNLIRKLVDFAKTRKYVIKISETGFPHCARTRRTTALVAGRRVKWRTSCNTLAM